MFTGIVQGVGRIVAVHPVADTFRLDIDAAAIGTSDVAVGDSIAVSGCCLTVVAIAGAILRFDLSAESRRCTTGIDSPRPVNLEKALRLSDHLGGHLMSGHVDGVGTVTRLERANGGTLLEVQAPAHLARFIAHKGSIAIDGVSLTVNDVSGQRFSMNLIPHTLAVTTLGALAEGSHVNLEIDMIARYVARLHEPGT